MKKLIVTALCCLLMVISSDIFACTSAIISGRVTPDGRPLLWKHRDTGAAQNLVRYFQGDKYAFSAIAQTDNPNPKSVWMGVNEAGFAIMNTMSYNIEPTEKEENADNNGYIMKLALGNCADAAEFETLLNSLDKPWLIAANLGVIDAKGNAYYYEVNNDAFVRFDVNDPATAPLGYIVRSNFSFAGDTERGVGYVRYMHADEVVKAGVMHNAITPEFIFNELSRSFENPLIGVNLKSGDFNRPKTTGWFVEQDFIARYTTVSSVVIQGVKEGEPVELTTMWTVVSYPPTTVAMPVWVCGGEEGIPILAPFGTGYRYHITGLTHDESGYPTMAPKVVERMNRRIVNKVEEHKEDIVEFESQNTEDAEILILSYGGSARSAKEAVLRLKAEGYQVGFFRPITIWPFPEKEVGKIAEKVKAIVVPEMNMGQLKQEVERVVAGRTKVLGVNKVDGELITPAEIITVVKGVE